MTDYVGEMMGSPFTGTELLGYDPEKQAYVSVWVDSMTPKISPLEGQYDPETKKLTMSGESVGMDGEVATMTNITEYIDENTMVFSMNMPGPEGEMAPMMTIHYTRKK